MQPPPVTLGAGLKLLFGLRPRPAHLIIITIIIAFRPLLETTRQYSAHY